MSRFLRGFLFAFALVCAAGVAAADPVKLDGTVIQGGLIVGHAVQGARVWQDGKELRIAPDGRFLVGFAHDAPPRSEIKIEESSGEAVVMPLTVAARQYEVEKIDNLPPAQVTPDAATLQRIATERSQVVAVLTRLSDTAMFEHPFAWPVTGIISGTYGSARILNGEPRSPHLGVDVAADAGMPILAPTEGVVVLVDDEFFTGNTVVLDHGYGLTSLYAHLSRVDVKPGDRVARGAQLGLMGKTGRATAPNLHWGVFLNGVALDPALLAGPMPQASK